MPKGNNAIPHVHQKKHFNPCSSQKGNIKVFLNQPAQKERRRRLRILKAKKVFPRPVKLLRPQVACPTVRYNMKQRLGRGFTIEELSAANVNPQHAATIGIRVDGRRKNISEESLLINTSRLKNYMSKLVIFPAHSNRGAAVTADSAKPNCFGIVYPPADAPRAVTAEERQRNVYSFLKKNHSAVRFLGARLKRAQRKASKESEKKQ